jgi:hypothetical protein
MENDQSLSTEEQDSSTDILHDNSKDIPTRSRANAFDKRESLSSKRKKFWEAVKVFKLGTSGLPMPLKTIRAPG